ncbi:hypothetical protein VDGL01_00510 [Verticillium dahliae]
MPRKPPQVFATGVAPQPGSFFFWHLWTFGRLRSQASKASAFCDRPSSILLLRTLPFRLGLRLRLRLGLRLRLRLGLRQRPLTCVKACAPAFACHLALQGLFLWADDPSSRKDEKKARKARKGPDSNEQRTTPADGPAAWRRLEDRQPRNGRLGPGGWITKAPKREPPPGRLLRLAHRHVTLSDFRTFHVLFPSGFSRAVKMLM